MKNMHDHRFDDELKHRLGNYTEEPDDALWQGIAAGISSAPAGLGWLRWVSRGFLVSFAVVSVLVNGSKFAASPRSQSSRLERDSEFNSEHPGRDSGFRDGSSLRLAVDDSKFKIQDSRWEDGNIEVACEDLVVSMEESTLAAGGEGNDSKGKARNTKPEGNDVKDVDRHIRVDRRGAKREAERSKVGGRQSARQGDKSAGRDRRSRAENGKRVAVVRRSRILGNDSIRGGRGRSRREENEVGKEALRSTAEGKRMKFEVRRSAREDSRSRAGVVGMKAGRGEPVAVVGAGGERGDGAVTVRGGEGHDVDSAKVGGRANKIDNDLRAAPGVVSQGTVTRTLTDETVPGAPSDEGMHAVFGPPLFMRRDSVVRAQQGMKRAVGAEMAQVPDSTKQMNALEKPRAARAGVLKKESEERRSDRPLRRVSLYFTAMPTLGYQRIEANPTDNIIVESFQKVSNFSSKRLGVRAELGVEYTLTPHVKVFGGVLYYQRKQTINYVERVTASVEHHTSGDTLTLDPQFSLQEKAFEYELKNIGVQLGVNYTLWKKKFLHVAGTGIELHKALNKLGEAQRMQGFSTHPSTYVFYNLYYRVQYPAEGRLKGIFQPTLNYSLFLNQDMNAPFYVKPYGLGLNLGLTYNF
jgi:hypothetical protein